MLFLVVQTGPTSSKSGRTPSVTNQDTRTSRKRNVAVNHIFSTLHVSIRVEEWREEKTFDFFNETRDCKKRPLGHHEPVTEEFAVNILWMRFQRLAKDPNLSLKLGYDSQEKPKRRKLFRHESRKGANTNSATNTLDYHHPNLLLHCHCITNKYQHKVIDEYSYCLKKRSNNCNHCKEKVASIEVYNQKVQQNLTDKLTKIGVSYRKKIKSSKPFSIDDKN